MSDRIFNRADILFLAAEPASQQEPSIADLAYLAASIVSPTPAIPANDNEQDWLTSLSRSCPTTIASLEEDAHGSWRGLVVIGFMAMCAAVGWVYVLEQSFRGLESLLN